MNEQRSIRSYVLRQGRMTDAQRAAHERLLPRYGLPYSHAPLDFARVFLRSAPVVLEIGFGMGETSAEIAASTPQSDYLGVEVHAPGVGSLLRMIEARELTNLRIVQHDAAEVVEHMIAAASLSGIHIFFPDPWPKKRHHKRRLLQVSFARLLVTRLRPGGYLHVATDWQDYAEWIVDVLGQTELENSAERYAPRPAYRPLTKFERRGLALGHAVHDIVFRRPL
ncbi:MAG: tRNA (guanosine(46)-N7)-methyltransferase TrmB [Betaproteobacteria bacterium]|nr:tRNA (guanosine(46)-N7)-methyltransferase TrmB [Betaproteobacteria bacterium]